MKKLFCISLTILFLLSVWARPVEPETGSQAEFDAKALDAFITGQIAKHGIKGISLAVTSKTGIVYLKGYGTAGGR